MHKFFIWVLLGILTASCSLTRIQKFENIPYMVEGFLGELPEKRLDVFAPRKNKQPKPVLLFIHGGSWRSGNKDMYGFLGRRMARRGVVTVIINYPLSPEYKVHAMAKASAKAVNWIAENIENYGGDPDRIFVSGHSAGGHLASLISVRDEYFDSLGTKNPIAGAVMIDAAGLDMYQYLIEQDNAPGTSLRRAFTDDPQVWKATSPRYHLHDDMPPMLFLMGGKTYESILEGTGRFMEVYREYEDEPDLRIQKNKRHVPMILQFFYTPSRAFRWVVKFVKETG